MDTLLTATDLAGDPGVIARAEAVRPAVAAAAAEIETGRRLPGHLLDKLHEQKLFLLLMPRTNKGIETDPITFFHVIETIARADASTPQYQPSQTVTGSKSGTDSTRAHEITC